MTESPALAADEFEIAVVGGGLVGAALAWGMARAGRRIALLDEGDDATRASRANFALVWVQSKGLGMPEYAAWTVSSSDAWSGFADELRRETGIDVAHSRPGGFTLALSEAELEARAETLRRFHNQPGAVSYRTEILGRAQLEAMLPGIGPEVAGASYCPLDGHVNSLKLHRALMTGIARRGSLYLGGRRVEAVDTTGGVFRIRTAGGEVRAAKVVFAAGNANMRLAPMVGLVAPMRPERGQIIVTERVAPFLNYPIVTLRQTDEGTVMIGDSREEGQDDRAMNVCVSSVMADRAVRMFPRLKGLNVVRMWTGIRVMTEDGFPIYDQSESHPGAFVVCCHSGVTLAAAHALRLAPMLASGRLEPVVAAFGARRFHADARG
jgi:glycine/D-amino acid oxidase-like deaminating enzyme